MITLLIIALLLLVALVGMRYSEIKKRKQTPVSVFLRRGDYHVARLYESIDQWWRKALHFSEYIKHTVIEKAWESLVHSVHFLKRKIDILHDRLNGKGVVKQSDHVSFYLKSVSDHKNSFRDKRDE